MERIDIKSEEIGCDELFCHYGLDRHIPLNNEGELEIYSSLPSSSGRNNFGIEYKSVEKDSISKEKLVSFINDFYQKETEKIDIQKVISYLEEYSFLSRDINKQLIYLWKYEEKYFYRIFSRKK